MVGGGTPDPPWAHSAFGCPPPPPWPQHGVMGGMDGGGGGRRGPLRSVGSVVRKWGNPLPVVCPFPVPWVLPFRQFSAVVKMALVCPAFDIAMYSRRGELCGDTPKVSAVLAAAFPGKDTIIIDAEMTLIKREGVGEHASDKLAEDDLLILRQVVWF